MKGPEEGPIMEDMSMSEYSAYVGLDVHKDSIAVSIARPPALQRSRPVSAIWMAYMADHAGWSSPFRFGHAWLVVWGPPFRRRGSARAVPRAVRPDGADAVHAATGLDRYRKRWTVETWSGTPRSGTRIRGRRPGDAGDLGKCLASGAVTACRVADLTMLARERPETPATETCPEEDIDLLHTLLEA